MKRSLASVVGKSNRLKLDKMEVTLPLPDRLMGIEIEVERVPEAVILTRPCPAGWSIVSDGSLRDGVEYKLASPLAGPSLAGAIEAMYQHNKFFRRHTSSCHIHVDILEEEVTEETLQSLFLLAFMTEEVLYQVGDSGRKWCGFTNTLTSLNDSQVAALVLGQEEYNNRYKVYAGNSREYDYFSDHLQGGSRYIGLNVQAMYKYGSIEFRYFPTPESKDELYNWVRIVQSYMKAAQSLDGLEAVKAMMETEDSYKSFISEFFSEWKQMFFNHADYDSSKTKLTYALTLADSAFVTAPDYVQPTYNVHKRFKRSKADPIQEDEREVTTQEDQVVTDFDVPEEPEPEASSLPDRHNPIYLGHVNQSQSTFILNQTRETVEHYRDDTVVPLSVRRGDGSLDGLLRFINDALYARFGVDEQVPAPTAQLNADFARAYENLRHISRVARDTANTPAPPRVRIDTTRYTLENFWQQTFYDF